MLGIKIYGTSEFIIETSRVLCLSSCARCCETISPDFSSSKYFPAIYIFAGVYILENTPPPPRGGGGNKYGLRGKKYYKTNIAPCIFVILVSMVQG